MLIVPGLPPLQQTRHSRELGRKVEALVRDYQRDNPDVTEGDVRAALAQLTSQGESPAVGRRKRALVMVAATLAAGVIAALTSAGGGRFENNTTAWRIIGAVVAGCAIVITAVRLARRS